MKYSIIEDIWKVNLQNGSQKKLLETQKIRMQILDHWPTTPAKPTELKKHQLYEAIGNLVTWDTAQDIKTHKNHTRYRKWSGFNLCTFCIWISEILLELKKQCRTILAITSSFFLLRQAYWIYIETTGHAYERNKLSNVFQQSKDKPFLRGKSGSQEL